jgi:CheY-like chemotaxis protein
MKQPDLDSKHHRDKTDEIGRRHDLTTEPVSDAHFRKAHVLVVDDDIDSLRALAEVLESEGFETVCAGNGQEAWEQMHRRRTDLIVLDLQMPKMDGRTLRMHQRREPNLATIPVVIVSAHTRDMLDVNAVAIFTKPLNVPAFLEVVHQTTKRTTAS